MKKMVIVALVLGIGFIVAGMVYANGWYRGGYGWHCGGYRMGYGTANVDRLRSFQKETLSLRDELIAKEFELRNEYNKPTPDLNRIASLRKEIIDLETKIEEIADKYQVSSWGPRGGMMTPGMMGPMYSMCPMAD